MRAVVYDRYGPPEVLRLAEVARPVPKEDELLVRIRAATVNRLDCHTREANRSNGRAISLLSRLVSGVRRPRQPILGSEFAGEVIEVGAGVRQFAAGDRVFGLTGLRFGCHAEYVTVRESTRVAQMPEGAAFEAAAPVLDGALNAMWCLHQAEPLTGKSVLVYGSSGAIGTAAVQLARHYGAGVTAVCSTKNLGLMQTLGADHAIDYTQEEFIKNGQVYDVIFDAVGKRTFAGCRSSLKPNGSYLATDGFGNLMWALWTGPFGRQKVRFTLPPRYPQQDVLLLKELIEQGKYRAVIDRSYPLDQVVEACRYVETEQKTGNVVLKVS